jgi:DNA-binding NarL/FixJ family response regulator
LREATSAAQPERPLRVLIVDDHPLFPELLFRLFHAHDWIEVVGCAANGRDGVMIASATKPDLILMDIDMPLMDGVEATRRILSNRWTVVIVLTASSTTEDHQRALEAGARVVLPKDTDPEEIVAQLRDAYLERLTRTARHPQRVLATTPW